MKNPVSRRALIRYGFSLFQIVLAVTWLADFVVRVDGQEALRLSLENDQAAESRQQAESTIGYYNLLLGPVAWRFEPGFQMQYDSNVRLQQNDDDGDFIASPNLDVQMHWPFSVKNSLDLTLGLGYSMYAINSDLDEFFINPESGLSFNIYAGHWVFNLHDRITITKDGYENPTVAGNGNNSVLQNSAGANGLWKLNKLSLNIGYDHANYLQLASAFQQFNGASENFYLQAGAQLIPEITAGLESGFDLIHYAEAGPAEPNANQWNAGGFCGVQLSQYIQARLDVGYTRYLPAMTSTNSGTSDLSGSYFQLSAQHRVSKFLNYSLAAGRMTDFALGGIPVNYYFVQLQPNWRILEGYTLSTPFSWEDGTNPYNGGGKFTQYNAGVSIGHNLTKKLYSTLSYQFIRENSNLSDLNYSIQIVSLNLNYKF